MEAFRNWIKIKTTIRRQDLKTWSAMIENMDTTIRLLEKMVDRINDLEDRDGEEWKYR